MRACWLLCLGACNWVYGLDQTRLPDPPGPDAAPRCSASGALAFSPRVTQAVIQECTDYTIQGTMAIAECGSGFLTTKLAGGPVDAPLVPIDIAATRLNAHLVAPRLTPDGDLIVHQELPTRSSVASVYRRDGEGWTWQSDLPFALPPFARAGLPSKGPRRHLMVTYADHIEEAGDDGTGNWTTTSSPFGALGVTKVNSAIHLSADGLRAVFTGATTLPEVRYAVRSRIDAPFEGSFPLTVPAAMDAYLTEDCSRLYFSGLGSIFYVPQL